MAEQKKTAFTKKKVCVIPDTNVWFGERLLLGPMGKAFLRSVKQQEARIGFPEVVEMELNQRVKEEARSLVKKWSDISRAISQFTGEKHWSRSETLSLDSFEKGLQRRLAQLTPLLERVSFSHLHAKGGLKRVVLGTAPSKQKSEEFRDCAIWEAALELSSSYNVHLITMDKGFYQDRIFNKGLDHELMEECKEAGTKVQIHESIEAYLGTFPAPYVSIPLAEIETMIENLVRSEVEANPGHQFTLGTRSVSDLQPFLTEDPDLFAIQFKQEFEIPGGLEDITNNYSNASVVISGSCTYDAKSKTVSDDARRLAYDFFGGGETRHLFRSIRTLPPGFLGST